MSWKGTALSQTESSALEKIFPMLVAEGRTRLTVGEVIQWLQQNPQLGIVGMKSSQKKRDVAADNPGMTVLDVQNALYHLSASSPKYVIHDSSGSQVTLLRKSGSSYEVI